MGQKPHLYLYLLVPAILFMLPGFSNAQVSVSANLSAEQIRPAGQLEVLLTLDEPTDAFFFSTEVLFDPDIFTFVSAEHTGIFSGGLSIADLLGEGKIGASVVLTSPLAVPASGDAMRIVFDVKRYAEAGETLIGFDDLQLINSLDEKIETEPIVDASILVEETITDLKLTIAGSNDVTEGDPFIVTSELFASGVTESTGNEGRLQVWVGLNQENTDPGTWDESVWELMDYTGSADSFYEYEAETALQKPIGSYYIAVRSELDENGELFYGGLGDFWDATNYPSATLSISEQPPFRYTLAAWDFDDETVTVSQSLPQNDDSELVVIGANAPGFAAGATGRAVSASGWSGYDPEIPKYWQIAVSTSGLENIQLSSKHAGTSSGPRDFQIQVSLDELDWIDVTGGLLTVTESFNDAVVENLPLPELVSDENEVYIRWLQLSDIRVNGDTVVTTGSNRIDDIIITGTNPNAQRIEVWAGDTNNDEVVNEVDILPLSAYWNSGGPIPIYPIRSWEAREVENWIPLAATYADANGDGVVNQNDLLPVGLNFGQNRSAVKQVWPDEAISVLELKQLRAGEELSLFILSEESIPLSGLSFRIRLDNISQNDWEIKSVTGTEWSEQWKAEGRLIEFNTKAESGISTSIAHRGVLKSDYPVQLLAEIKLTALRDWQFNPTAELIRVSVLNGRNIVTAEQAILSHTADGSITGPGSEVPEQTVLLQNFPNPFNPATNIRYTLSIPSEVRVEVYNAIGHKVATLIEGSQPAGEYALPFDASTLSSGVYFYRLQTQNFTQTKSMVLIK